MQILFSFSVAAQTPMRMLTKKAGAAAYDADAQAFFDATGITDATQKTAVNQLVVDLKAASIWTKYKAIYPMVGGTEALHKWNLKDPQDTDAAFRLTFSGTWSHSSTGADPNGTTAYANTFLIPNTSLGLNSSAVQYYSTDNLTVNGYEMGCRHSNTSSRTSLVIKWTDNNSYTALNTATISAGNVVSDTRGLFTACRTASNVTAWYKNGSSIATGTDASVALSTTVLYIGATNENGTASSFTTRNCAGAAIADGLTSGEVTSSYNAWQTFQTTMSRQQ